MPEKNLPFFEMFALYTPDAALAAQVKDFNAKDYMDPKAARRMETFSQFAVKPVQ